MVSKGQFTFKGDTQLTNTSLDEKAKSGKVEVISLWSSFRSCVPPFGSHLYSLKSASIKKQVLTTNFDKAPINSILEFHFKLTANHNKNI